MFSLSLFISLQNVSFVTFLLFVRVVDRLNADDTTQVVITVVDVNDNRPAFSNLPHSIQLPEVGHSEAPIQFFELLLALTLFSLFT